MQEPTYARLSPLARSWKIGAVIVKSCDQKEMLMVLIEKQTETKRSESMWAQKPHIDPSEENILLRLYQSFIRQISLP